MSVSKAIDAFNSLIVINNDRIKGYVSAANEMGEPDLKQFFVELSDTSLNCRNELRKEVIRLGGTPDDDAKTSGKFFKAWVNIQTALAGHDINTVIGLCETAENGTLDAYKNILIQEVHEIKAPEQEVLNRQYALLKADYKKIKLIRNVLKSEQKSNE